MVGFPLFGKEGSGTPVFKILVRALLDAWYSPKADLCDLVLYFSGQVISLLVLGHEKMKWDSLYRHRNRLSCKITFILFR